MQKLKQYEVRTFTEAEKDRIAGEIAVSIMRSKIAIEVIHKVLNYNSNEQRGVF
jgi:hypothetical protein